MRAANEKSGVVRAVDEWTALFSRLAREAASDRAVSVSVD
jgi:hypothetical protein